MLIPDKQRTERHLANISYYRLSAYMLPYKQKENGKILDSFREGVAWDMVYNLCIIYMCLTESCVCWFLML